MKTRDEVQGELDDARSPVVDLADVISGMRVRFSAGPTGLLMGGTVEHEGHEDTVFVLAGGWTCRVLNSVDPVGLAAEGIREAVRRILRRPNYRLPE